MLQIRKNSQVYGNTKLAIVPILPSVCACEKPEYHSSILEMHRLQRPVIVPKKE